MLLLSLRNFELHERCNCWNFLRLITALKTAATALGILIMSVTNEITLLVERAGCKLASLNELTLVFLTYT
jgi:hypothetical protein